PPIPPSEPDGGPQVEPEQAPPSREAEAPKDEPIVIRAEPLPPAEGAQVPLPSPFRRRDSAPAAPRMVPAPSRTPYPTPDDDGQHAREPELPRSAVAANLSPRMTAIFGGLFGLACVTSIVALLIQVVPPRDERLVAAKNAPSAAPGAAGKAARVAAIK